MPLIRVDGVARRFGAVAAVDGVSFDVGAGEIVGLLGPNGAGKTTLVECLLGLIRPDAGTLTVCGLAAGSRAARARIGAVLQATGLQDAITPREALRLYASFHPAPLAVGTLLARFGLTEKAGAAYHTLSGGQKQRLALALAFAGDPPVLVLDEPTTGLDPQMRRELHDHIRALRQEGRAVLLTTHDMGEAQTLCDRVAVMTQGRIVAMGTPAALAEDQPGATLEDVILRLTGRS